MADGIQSPNERLLLLHGADDFSRGELVRRLVADLGEDAAFNVSTFEGEKLAPDALQAAAASPPFLGERRVVLVEGLLSRFQPRSERGSRSRVPELGPWAGSPAMLQALPPTTTLVFSDGVLAANNPLLRLLRPLVSVREFRPLRGQDLHQWVLDRGRRLGAQVHDGAARLLVAVAGDDLWVLQGELEKLALFGEGRPITEEMVRLVGSGAREANVFELVNAILARRRPDALRLLHDLLRQGVAPTLVLFMMARQFRVLLRALDLLGGSPEQARASLGLGETWQAERALRQARDVGRDGLLRAHSRLVEADLAMKTGRYSSEMALELLVVDLSGARRLLPAG